MTQHDDSVNARLDQLYADYQRQLPERINYVAQQFAAYWAPPHPPTALQNLHHALHKLAGSGATFGHTEMGKVAHLWEHLASALLNDDTLPIAPQWEEMHSLLAELSRTATLRDEFRPS